MARRIHRRLCELWDNDDEATTEMADWLMGKNRPKSDGQMGDAKYAQGDH